MKDDAENYLIMLEFQCLMLECNSLIEPNYAVLFTLLEWVTSILFQCLMLDCNRQ